MDEKCDESWVNFCKDPSEKNFNPVYDRTKGLVWTICLRVLGNQDDAGDAYQATWQRLFVELKNGLLKPELESQGPVSIYRLALHEAHNLRMRRRRRSFRERIMDWIPDMPARGIPADQIMAASQLREQLETLVRLLPEESRLPIQLHYFHGLSQMEIATILERDKSTVSRRLARGLKQLKRLIRQAGLCETALIATLAGGTAILDPPVTMAAAAIYAQSQAALTAGGLASVGTSQAMLGKILSGAVMMKKAIMAGLLILTVGVGMMISHGGLKAWVDSGPGHPLTHPSSMATKLEEKTDGAAATSAPGDTKSADLTSASRQRSQAANDALPRNTTTTMAAKITTQTLSVRTIWQDNKKPVVNARLQLVLVMGDNVTSSRTMPVTSGKSGEACVPHPSNWAEAYLNISHAESAPTLRRLDLSRNRAMTIELERAAGIYGNVWERGGHDPVAGAEVRLYDLQQKVEEGRKATPNQIVMTNKDGEFRFTNLAASSYHLLATKGEKRSFLKDDELTAINVVASEESGPHELTLKPGITLSGLVTDTSGNPIPQASIRQWLAVADQLLCQKYLPENLETVSDASGRYEVKGLPVTLVKFAVKAEGFCKQDKFINLTEGENFCDFALAPASTIDVQVVDDQQQPVEGAKVFVATGISGLMSDPTDAQGNVEIKGVNRMIPPSLWAMKTGYRKSKEIHLAFKPGESSVSTKIEMKRLASGCFAGRVTDSLGAPMANMRVMAAPWEDYSETTHTTYTDNQGHYRVQVDSQDGEYVVAVSPERRDFAPAWRDRVKPGASEKPVELNFMLEAGHWSRGRIVSKMGKAIPGVKVLAITAQSFQIYDGFPIVKNETLSDEDGHFALKGLPSGKAFLRFEKKGYSSIWREEHPVDQEIQVTLRAQGVIRVRVIDSQTGGWIPNISILTGSTQWQDISALGGQFEVSDLDMDESYEVIVKANGYAPGRRTNVAATAREDAQAITFALKAGVPLRGRIIDEETRQPLAGVSVVYNYFQGGNIYWNFLGTRRIVQNTMTDIAGGFHFMEADDPGTLLIQAQGHLPRVIFPKERPAMMRDGVLIIPLIAGSIPVEANYGQTLDKNH